jgi:hypothetical protein
LGGGFASPAAEGAGRKGKWIQDRKGREKGRRSIIRVIQQSKASEDVFFLLFLLFLLYRYTNNNKGKARARKPPTEALMIGRAVSQRRRTTIQLKRSKNPTDKMNKKKKS